MRWIVFLVFAVLILTLHVTLGVRVALLGITPDLMLGLVLFLALYARPHDAVAGAWAAGLLGDLFTVEHFGVLTLSYMVGAAMIVKLRSSVFRHAAGIQFVLAVAGFLPLHTGWAVYRYVRFDHPVWLLGHPVAEVLAVTVYSSLCAVIITQLLMNAAHWFGFRPIRYRHRGIEFAGGGDV